VTRREREQLAEYVAAVLLVVCAVAVAWAVTELVGL
jgi:hypothetical protein